MADGYIGPRLYTAEERAAQHALLISEARLLSMMYEGLGMYPGCAVAINAIIAKTQHELRRMRENPPMRAELSAAQEGK